MADTRFVEVLPHASIGVTMNDAVLVVAHWRDEPEDWSVTIERKMRSQLVKLANWALDHGCHITDNWDIQTPEES